MAVDLSGTILSERYRVLHLIGDGGMGRVYAAEHITLRRRMAIKVLREELSVDESNVDRFLQEAQAASAINHENVVDITDFGRTPAGSVFFVMEFLEGEELAGLMHREAPMVWPAAQPIILQVVRGLKAAHERGVIHRDMKPANIFLARTDNGDTKVKLLDFGIAKLQREGRRPHTRRGSVFGTARYMSPEQAAGREVDRRSDIYAVGVVLYEMLTGHAPFESDNFMEVVGKHINEPIVPPRQLAPNAGIPEVVEDLVMRALAKDPNDRYPNMAEFEAAIQSASFESTVATVNPLMADNLDRTIVWDAERGRRAREAASIGYAAASGYGGSDPYAGSGGYGTPGIHCAPAPAANEQTVIRARPMASPGRARFSGRNNHTPMVSMPPPPPMQHIGVNHPTFPPPARGAGPIVRAGEGAFFSSSSMAQAEGEGGRFAAVLPTGADVPSSEPVEHRTLPPVNWVGPNPSTGEHGGRGHEGIETAEFALNVPKHTPSRNLLVILVAAIAVLCIVGGVTTWALFFNDEGVVEEEVYATVVVDQPRPPVEVEPIEPAKPAKVAEPEPEPPRIEVEPLEEDKTVRRPRGGLGRARPPASGFGGARAAIGACGRQHGAIEGTSLRITFDVIGGRASSVSVQRPYSVTPLGRCVANAVSSHARFPGADAPGQSRRVDF